MQWSTNRQWCVVVWLMRRIRVSPLQILTTVMTNIVVDNADHAKPSLICFFITIDVKYNDSFSVTRGETRWREQRCLFSYRHRQIGQSDCDITASFGKKSSNGLRNYYNNDSHMPKNSVRFVLFSTILIDPAFLRKVFKQFYVVLTECYSLDKLRSAVSKAW